MRSAGRAAAGLVIALGVIYALAHGHAAAPAAAPPSSGGSGGSVLWDKVLPVLGFVGLGWAALAYYHRRKMRALNMAAAKLDGFVNVNRSELSDLWRCPDCHALILLADVDDHEEESACARMAPLIGQIETLEGRLEQLIQDIATRRVGTPEWAAEWIAEPPEDDEHVTATLPPEHSVTTGGYDSIEG